MHAVDTEHIWHPYTSMLGRPAMVAIKSTQGVRLRTYDGRELIDGMSSWWAAIHGYNHPHLLQALAKQASLMPHVMFGGLTHAPAARLIKRLTALTPPGLDQVFLCDSGSVAVEVGVKMSLQYWASLGKPGKARLLTIRSGYHGDTFGTMAICDPEKGMHGLFKGILTQHLFAPQPRARLASTCRAKCCVTTPASQTPCACRVWLQEDVRAMEDLLVEHHATIAAVVLEPIVQGAGGMWF